jgi:hypothetical protein
MNGDLAPSKSTVYAIQLALLSDTDLHRIFLKYGKIVEVKLLGRVKGFHLF